MMLWFSLLSVNRKVVIYSKTIISGKSGDSDASRSVTLPVSKGLVYRIEVDFPPGCCGLLSVKVFDGSYQVWPSSRDDSFAGDGQVIAFDDSYLKLAAPYEFRIETINSDLTYTHKTQVRIGMASSEAFMSRYMPSITWDKFNEVLAKAAIEQDKMREAAIKQAAKELKILTNG